VIAGGKWIRREDLFLNATGVGQGGGDRNLKTAMNAFRANFIRKVLDENQWNQTETAKALDIQRTYLSRLMKELNIRNG
jgi:Nif-specific regulatory protein